MKDKILDGFSFRLKEKLEARGMTQADLRRRTTLTTSMISHYCAGQRLPNIPAAMEIAEALDTTIDYLASGIPSGLNRVDSVAEQEIPYLHGKSLSEPERQSLPQLFHLLNPEGQSKVLEYIEDLLSNGKYN